MYEDLSLNPEDSHKLLATAVWVYNPVAKEDAGGSLGLPVQSV